eukprot:TRINITY_DN25716_c0_g1_i1.p1 TRINITY_DN25716_c0_g1~~TRINITY_DN25716_c0_g1_i1.p1  ORF type:complete len:405 (-),score=63.03 TRINITY_DN25716_c0_g1_i1:104-1318(-)
MIRATVLSTAAFFACQRFMGEAVALLPVLLTAWRNLVCRARARSTASLLAHHWDVDKIARLLDSVYKEWKFLGRRAARNHHHQQTVVELVRATQRMALKQTIVLTWKEACRSRRTVSKLALRQHKEMKSATLNLWLHSWQMLIGFKHVLSAQVEETNHQVSYIRRLWKLMKSRRNDKELLAVSLLAILAVTTWKTSLLESKASKARGQQSEQIEQLQKNRSRLQVQVRQLLETDGRQQEQIEQLKQDRSSLQGQVQQVLETMQRFDSIDARWENARARLDTALHESVEQTSAIADAERSPTYFSGLLHKAVAATTSKGSDSSRSPCPRSRTTSPQAFIPRSTFCLSCGNVYMADAMFCRRCGKRREVELAAKPFVGTERRDHLSSPTRSRTLPLSPRQIQLRRH